MSIKRIGEDHVRAVPEPEWTDTWHPVAHFKVLDALDIILKVQGIGIINKVFTLNKSGVNLFGTYILDCGENSKYMIGFRNSLAKLFSLGFCAGNHVTVCSNMMFSGQFMDFRRHTGGLNWEELLYFTETAFQKVFEIMGKLKEWQENLKNKDMKENEFKILTFNAIQQGALLPSKFNEFISSFENQGIQEKEFKNTLHQFHGGFTRMLRNESLFNISYRTPLIKNLLDEWIENYPVLNRRAI